ncbi:hypothetical protein [Hyalangium versicolor]|uniref:hypothetical protein n=1 Tax=Hyalangium versicolor TaxID=2861190 RepID=UPI001CCA7D55|nr:hypothetical protein [Hyalangium versicolor]
MKNTLLPTLPAPSLSGCAVLGTGSRTGGGTTVPSDESVPKSPAEQVISDRGPVPDLPASTHIVVGVCQATGAYVALGVDTKSSKFTFLLSGKEPTRQQAFQKFEAASIPVTVYTATTALLPGKEGATIAFNPCLNLQSGAPRVPLSTSSNAVANITEDPPPSPKPTGGEFSNRQAFEVLSWRTAFALNGVGRPVTEGASPF